MFKKKPIYIILLIVFTLLLGADIFVYSMSSNTSSNMPDTSSDSRQQMGQDMNSGEDSGTDDTSDTEDTSVTDTSEAQQDGESDSSQMQSDGEMPEMSEDFDPTEMQGGTDGEMPEMSEDFDPTEMQGGTDGEMPEMSGDFDPTEMQGAASTTSGLVSFVSSWWIPIGVFCLLMDALCIFMLIRISKRQKLAAEGSEAESEEEAFSVVKPKISGFEKRRLKKRRSRIILITLLVIIVVIVIAYAVMRSIYAAQLAKEEALSVLSSEAEGTEIDTFISGTGTLEESDAQEITVPNGVEIESYSVEDGDVVEEGDVLAMVNQTSVVKTIAEVQEALDSLDEDIEDASSDEIESTIEASVDGRVKVIYAEEDVSVADTMYENGALMLVSLDGLMAADIETDAQLAAGDSVNVVLEDGTELEGRVDSVSEGVASITVTDEETVYGETVTVYDEDGNELGAAELYIHSELKVTGYTGTVSAVKSDVDDEVSAGDTLMTLTDTEYTAEYDQLVVQRSEYEEVMNELFVLYQDNNIYAEFSGTVSGVDESTTTEDEDSSEQEAAEEASDSAAEESTEEASDSAAEETTEEVSDSTAEETTEESGDSIADEASADTSSTLSGSVMTLSATVSTSNTAVSLSNTAQTTDDTDALIEGEEQQDSGTSEQPGEGTGSQGTSEQPGEGTTEPQEGGSSNSGSPTAGDYQNYPTTVTKVSFGSITVMMYPESVSVSDYSDTASLGITTDMMTAEKQVSPSDSTPVYMYQNGAWITLSANDISVGDELILTYSGEGDENLEWIVITSKSQNSGEETQDTSGGSSGGGSSGSLGSSLQSVTEEEEEELYTISDTTVLSLTPDELMSVSITIDELDILSMETGQEASITLDAISGETFIGSVTEIDMTGTNSGGSTKYTAVVTIDKTEQMLAGMNAAVTITLSQTDCAVTIPVAALYESGTDVYVYTSYDEELQEFGNPVSVTTGLSDGMSVEILSGIESGEEVWYEYDDTVNVSSSTVSSSNGSGFNMMQIFGGGR